MEFRSKRGRKRVSLPDQNIVEWRQEFLFIYGHGRPAEPVFKRFEFMIVHANAVNKGALWVRVSILSVGFVM